MTQFIAKQGASNFYLQSGQGAGGFLNPPQHAAHTYSVIEKRSGHEVGFYSLESATKEEWMPHAVKIKAAHLLKQYPGVVTEEWIISVYKHLNHCYSPDGTERSASKSICYGKFWDNADQEKNVDPETHLGYLYVKEFDSTHAPRLDLMERPQ